jgi:HEAT repeat protein
MPTLDELQKLDDGQFHQLCDDLLRRLEHRYRRLRTHGVNAEGVSIKGQPDSYVGETANTCTNAFCYTVQRAGWWNKVVEDVKEAVTASPSVREIVVAIPHNADRDGPKDKNIDWLGAARTAAGLATLRVVDGRDIARLLDTDHQDLRFEHLRIRYSRLSGQSILASCRRANEEAIAEVVASGRYDPARYAPREADRELFALWQRALRPDTQAGSSKLEPTRLVPLVNDSGVGKTSLLSAFARSVGSVLPAVLLQARNLAFASEDSLVTHLIHVLQGVLEPKARWDEEAAITRHLAADAPLTVVLDGLDEARDAASVRRAINYWLKSKLGQASVLIVSSRPEFWKVCVDRAWSRWMPKGSEDDRTPFSVAMQSSVERTDPVEGIRLPDKFTEAELEAVWVRAGQAGEQLFALPAEAREELRHPFTLRVYLDLLREGSVPPRLTTRAGLLEAWLNRRLDAEAVPEERLTRQQFQETLRIIATRLAEATAGSLVVDDLADADVPRFDAAHPPGPAVERLIAANILESVPGSPDRIRFVVETVQDFYRAESEVAAIAEAPAQAAERFCQLGFTEAYPRLARIGQLLVNQEARHAFAEHLASADPRLAAVVVRADPTKYTQGGRRKVVEELGRQIASRHRVRAAFAIYLLSDLQSEESCECLAAHLLAPAQPHPSLKIVGAVAFAKLGCSAGVELVYEWPWFGFRSDDSYYFKDMLAIMRTARAEFKAELAEYALGRLGATSGHKEHVRAVTVLAYLGDDRLAAHLNDRLTENDSLLEYENHALIALGTAEAGQVFFRSAIGTARNISELDYKDGGMARYRLHLRVSSATSDHQYLGSPQFEPWIANLVNDENKEAASIGVDLAIRSRRPSLIHQAILAQARRRWMESARDEVRGAIPPDAWLGWWRGSNDPGIRRTLLGYLPIIPNAEIEQILIDCLDSPDFRGKAASHLGHYGCYRAAAYLRQLLHDCTGGVILRQKEQAATALGLLRDKASVEQLRSLAVASPEDAALFAVHSLGFIGTKEAEEALNTLIGTEVDEQDVAGALICCGSCSAVSKAVELARLRPDGPKWLCECVHMAFWTRGYHRGQFYTHISTAPLVDFLASNEKDVANKWDLVRAFEQIDSEEVRELLRQWAGQQGTPADAVVRDNDQLRMSALCYDELLKRGDEYAIKYYLDYRSNEEDFIYVHLAVDNLSHFPSERVAKALRSRLASAQEHSWTARLLSLLGQFGDSSDEGSIRPFLDHTDDRVANVACESLLRLTDPVLVPHQWREL